MLIEPAHEAWVDLNPEAERALLLVHGWPGLWSTWSNQIEEFRVSRYYFSIF